MIKIEAIYDINCNIVGWASNDIDIFDTNLEWIAFISDCFVFSTENLNWLGGFIEGTFTDKEGKALAWIDGSQPVSAKGLPAPFKPHKPVAPLKPRKPREPLKPTKPLMPLGGWSRFSWNEWISQ